jgi:hypothetical protein
MKTTVSVRSGGGIATALIILLLAGGVFLFWNKYQKAKKEIVTLEATKTALLEDTVKYYLSKAGKLVAEVEKITLQRNELDKYNTQVKKDLKNMKVKLRDAEMYISTQLSTIVKPPDIPLRDTVYLDREKPVLAKSFEWSDSWGGMGGVIYQDTVKQPYYHSRDTITGIGEKVFKYKFLGLRFKVVGAKLKVSSKNPHSEVSLPEYVQLE